MACGIYCRKIINLEQAIPNDESAGFSVKKQMSDTGKASDIRNRIIAPDRAKTKVKLLYKSVFMLFFELLKHVFSHFVEVPCRFPAPFLACGIVFDIVRP